MPLTPRHTSSPAARLFLALFIAQFAACGAEPEQVPPDADTTTDILIDTGAPSGDVTTTDILDDTGTPSGDVTTTDILDDTAARYGCSSVHMDSIEGPTRSYSCAGPEAAGDFACTCDGAPTNIEDAASCEDAFADACDVPPADNFCDDGDSRLCVEDEGGWQCLCTDEEVSVAGGTCPEALFQACAIGCDDWAGECAPNYESGVIDCSCTDGRTGSAADVNCARALNALCAPACESSAGMCAVNQDHVSFDCQCAEDADFQNLRYDDLGHDAPCVALESLCGEGTTPETTECEAESADGTVRGRCEIRTDGGYGCVCISPDGEDAATGGGNTGGCVERLRGFCPDAFE